MYDIFLMGKLRDNTQNPGSGKTTLFQQLTNQGDPEYSTASAELTKHQEKRDFQIWDMPARTSSYTQNIATFKKPHGIIFIFDADDAENNTFTDYGKTAAEIVKLQTNNPKIMIVINEKNPGIQRNENALRHNVATFLTNNNLKTSAESEFIFYGSLQTLGNAAFIFNTLAFAIDPSQPSPEEIDKKIKFEADKTAPNAIAYLITLIADGRTKKQAALTLQAINDTILPAFTAQENASGLQPLLDLYDSFYKAYFDKCDATLKNICKERGWFSHFFSVDSYLGHGATNTWTQICDAIAQAIVTVAKNDTALDKPTNNTSDQGENTRQQIYTTLCHRHRSIIQTCGRFFTSPALEAAKACDDTQRARLGFQ